MAQEPWVYILRLLLFLLLLVFGAGGLFKLCFECSQCVSGAVLNVPQFLLDANVMISKRWFSHAFSSWDTLLQVYFGWTLPPEPFATSFPFLCSSALFPFLSACTSLSSRGPRPPPPPCDLQAQVPVVVSCWLQQVVGRPQY